MRLVNFTFDSSTCIGIAGHPCYLDLHGIYGWQNVTYLPEQRRIMLTWTGPSKDQLWPDLSPDVAARLNSLPPVVTLEFRGVSRFAASPNDPEMPYEEDTCLDSVTLAPPEHTSDKREFKIFRSDSGHVAFLFRSGFGLKIWAEEAELIYDEAAQPVAGAKHRRG